MEKIKVYKYFYGKWLPNGFLIEPNTETKSKNKSNETHKKPKRVAELHRE